MLRSEPDRCDICGTTLCSYCGDCRDPDCDECECDCQEDTRTGGFDADELGLDPEDDGEFERRQRG